MDCKKALTESDGDIEKAMEIIRKKGQAIACLLYTSFDKLRLKTAAIHSDG